MEKEEDEDEVKAQCTQLKNKKKNALIPTTKLFQQQQETELMEKEEDEDNVKTQSIKIKKEKKDKKEKILPSHLQIYFSSRRESFWWKMRMKIRSKHSALNSRRKRKKRNTPIPTTKLYHQHQETKRMKMKSKHITHKSK